MKSTELLLITAMLTDVGIATHTSIVRDVTTVTSRFEHEGLSFLTITLPTFAKDFERSLEQGRITSNEFRSFSKLRSSRLIPRFLSGIVSNVFDRDGVLRTDASVESIDGVRQICLAYNKLKQECTNERQAQAIRSFRKCEDDLRSFRPKSWTYGRSFDLIVRMCFGELFSKLECKLLRGDLTPKHGPGAVMERIHSNDKYRRKVWSDRLERYFPADTHLFCNAEDLLSATGKRELSYSKGNSDAVRVIFVPKTQKSPRVIAIEPLYNQYTQQSLLKEIVEVIEADPHVGRSIFFTNSEHNGRLARQSSIDRRYATLDLSEASDRVHAGLAYNLFRHSPELARAIFSCRTKYASLPDGSKIPLIKFASMGSALCFPVEAMVFFTMCVLGVLEARKLTVTRKNVRLTLPHISVFGDDLVVPSDTVSHVIRIIESAGLKVNLRKTFVLGNFRESCGVDAYKGYNVTPIYIRTMFPRSMKDAKKFVSALASANLLYKKGYWHTARQMRSLLEAISGPLPHVGDNSPLLGHTSLMGSTTIERWNKTLHRFETRGYQAKVAKTDDKLESYDRLLKFFLTRVNNPLDEVSSVQQDLNPSEQDGFNRSTVRSSLYLKRRWNTPV